MQISTNINFLFCSKTQLYEKIKIGESDLEVG